MSTVLAVEGAMRVPIHLWSRTPPPRALAQLRALASQPYVVERVAAMPDLHVAHGVAVGTVFATEHTVVPSALGGDLGCGMAAVRFDAPASALSRSALEEILTGWSGRIPVGEGLHRGAPALSESLRATALSTHALEHVRARRGPSHLGTLGGGNHFVELDRGTDGSLWLLVHSGSRGMGSAIAAHHERAAQASGGGSAGPLHGPLPGLDVRLEPGAACLADLGWALEFARANRARLVGLAASVVEEVCGARLEHGTGVDVHHNFVAREAHFGRWLLVHRKGAIAAPLGEGALIPGSMGTASYLVRGLGNPESFGSGSHGAGRVLTRTESRRRVKPQRLVHAMRRVVFDRRRARELVEEAPESYRDIAEVLEDEEDLVQPLLRLEPLVVLKG